MKSLRSVSVLVLFLLPMALHAQIANHVVISEFATRGAAANAAGEFVEIYNPTAQAVNISGWALQYQSASGSSYNPLVTVPEGTVMPPKSYFLFTSPTWSGTPAGDVSWGASGLADNGNIRIVNASGTPVDRVGYGSGNNPEGAAAPNHGESANDNSVERKASASSTAASLAAGGAEEFAGNGWDSNNNESGPQKPASVQIAFLEDLHNRIRLHFVGLRSLHRLMEVGVKAVAKGFDRFHSVVCKCLVDLGQEKLDPFLEVLPTAFSITVRKQPLNIIDNRKDIL